ncbi:hypothetical protein N9769_02180 [Ascidiaceihabitans sp.]|nr:hypothetical protein [Ascidiaceihabitans sp.]
MRILASLIVVAFLAACSSQPPSAQATDEIIAQTAYREAGPATLTLITMINNGSQAGAHTALLINGSQRVIFDPAGSFRNERVPRRDDVLYGIRPAVLAAYKGAHARSEYHIVLQTVEVKPEVAEQAIRLAIARGSVGDAQCAASTIGLLRQLDGFSQMSSTLFPKRLMNNFATLSGVQTEKYYEDDEGTILDGIAKVQL